MYGYLGLMPRHTVPPMAGSSNHDDLPTIIRIGLIIVSIFSFWDGLAPKSLPLSSYPSNGHGFYLPCVGEQDY